LAADSGASGWWLASERRRISRGGPRRQRVAIDGSVKKMWIELQKKNETPVNAIGVRIEDNDKESLKIWRKEGIDRFLRRV
jgi:hypothetical protein